MYEDAVVVGDHGREESPPGYSHPGKGSGVEMGANGYAVRFTLTSSHYSISSLTTISKSQLDKKNNHDQDFPVTRRPSRRQQEKAPEGQAPHQPRHDDEDAEGDGGRVEGDAGPAPVESKFQEELG